MNIIGTPRRIPKSEIVDGKLPDSNPVVILLDEIIQSFTKFDCKRELYKHIKQLVKNSQSEIIGSSNYLWLKKYEIQEKEMIYIKTKLQKALNVNDILVDRIRGLNKGIESIGSKMSSTDRSIVLGQPEVLSNKGIDESLDCQPNKTQSLPNQLEQTPWELKSSNQSCPLCSRNLHDVYDLLEQKETNIQSLKTCIDELYKKGRVIASQANSSSEEVISLNRVCEELKGTISGLEQQTARNTEKTDVQIRHYITSIEKLRREKEELSEKIRELESHISIINKGNILEISKKRDYSNNSLSSMDNQNKREPKVNMIQLPIPFLDGIREGDSIHRMVHAGLSQKIEVNQCTSCESTNKNSNSRIQSKKGKFYYCPDEDFMTESNEERIITPASMDKQTKIDDIHFCPKRIVNLQEIKRESLPDKNHTDQPPEGLEQEIDSRSAFAQLKQQYGEKPSPFTKKRRVNKKINRREEYNCVLI